MTLFIGVDFHPHQQTVCYCNSADGEIKTIELVHNQAEVKKFYQQFDESAVIGIEASSKAIWFERLLNELGHELKVGNPSLIRARARSRHKSDRRDAELLLDLLMADEFPAVWRRPLESEEILEQLRFRHQLVRQRTQICNRLQAIGHAHGLAKRAVQTKLGRARLENLELSAVHQSQRDHLFELLDDFSERIKQVQKWLEDKAANDPQVQVLITHPGVGPLTALATVHTLGDLDRFANSKQIVAFVGLDPVEYSSAGRRRFGSISKKGSPLLRFLLGQCIQKATRFDGAFKEFYERVAGRRGKPVAKVAVARKLLIRLSLMLRNQIDYAEFVRRGRTVGRPVGAQGRK